MLLCRILSFLMLPFWLVGYLSGIAISLFLMGYFASSQRLMYMLALGDDDDEYND
jgi:uncharacterized membrane protein YwzB